MASTPATENSNMDTRDTLRDWLTLMTVTIAVGALVSFLFVTRYTASVESKAHSRLAEIARADQVENANMSRHQASH